MPEPHASNEESSAPLQVPGTGISSGVQDLRAQLSEAFFVWLNQPDDGQSMARLAAEGADTAWTVVQPALDAKDDEIAALKAGMASTASDALAHRLCGMHLGGAIRRAKRAEATILRFAAEAHRRKWAHRSTHPHKDSPAFEELHRLGNDLLAALAQPGDQPTDTTWIPVPTSWLRTEGGRTYLTQGGHSFGPLPTAQPGDQGGTRP